MKPFHTLVLVTLAFFALANPRVMGAPQNKTSKPTDHPASQKSDHPGDKGHAHAGPESIFTLREVMQDLGQQHARLHLGLLTGNRLLIEQGAHAIANHPRPKGGIAPYIKKNAAELMKAIPAMDKTVHDSAATIAQNAKTAPLAELHQLATEMTKGCLACHAQFRE
jgi:hypothetical protein